MSDFTILVASWSDGVFALSADGRQHELQGCCVAGLTSGGGYGAVAVVDGTSLVCRSPDGSWAELATSGVRVECCLAVDGVIYAGAEGAHLLRVRGARVERVEGFEVTVARYWPRSMLVGSLARSIVA